MDLCSQSCSEAMVQIWSKIRFLLEPETAQDVQSGNKMSCKVIITSKA